MGSSYNDEKTGAGPPKSLPAAPDWLLEVLNKVEVNLRNHKAESETVNQMSTKLNKSNLSKDSLWPSHLGEVPHSDTSVLRLISTPHLSSNTQRET